MTRLFSYRSSQALGRTSHRARYTRSMWFSLQTSPFSSHLGHGSIRLVDCRNELRKTHRYALPDCVLLISSLRLLIFLLIFSHIHRYRRNVTRGRSKILVIMLAAVSLVINSHNLITQSLVEDSVSLNSTASCTYTEYAGHFRFVFEGFYFYF